MTSPPLHMSPTLPGLCHELYYRSPLDALRKTLSPDNNSSGGRSLGTAPQTSRSPNHGCVPQRRRASGRSARGGASTSGGNSAGRDGGAGSGVGGTRIGMLRDIAPVPTLRIAGMDMGMDTGTDAGEGKLAVQGRTAATRTMMMTKTPGTAMGWGRGRDDNRPLENASGGSRGASAAASASRTPTRPVTAAPANATSLAGRFSASC
jgi:hypothetical protein